jgi:hypothetical protein
MKILAIPLWLAIRPQLPDPSSPIHDQRSKIKDQRSKIKDPSPNSVLSPPFCRRSRRTFTVRCGMQSTDFGFALHS